MFSHWNKNQTPSKDDILKCLRDCLADVPILEDEPNFFNNDETLLRFLKARDWDLKEAEKQLKATIEWRRIYKPIQADCKWCHESPGMHSMRQVGFDEAGRPVIYSCFAQAVAAKNTVEDSVAHCTYVIENATRSMRQGITTWVFIIDCTGITLPLCNPKLGFGCVQVMSNYYPERLEAVLCVNHSHSFEGVYKAISVFLHPRTKDKVKLVKKRKMRESFEKYFNEELTDWLMEEIRRNKDVQLLPLQREFWKPPQSLTERHDPRGCPNYVQFHVENRTTKHRPHPNIEDFEDGKVLKTNILQNFPNIDDESSDEGNDAQQHLDAGNHLQTEMDIPAEYLIKKPSTENIQLL